MKLVLIQPPVEDFYDTPIRLQPIGLAYLKAAVARHVPGVDVVIKDFHHRGGKRSLPLPEDLADLREYFPWPDRSPFSSFYQYYHFGASFEAIAEEVARERPDLVGISSLFSPYFREVFRCAEEIRKRIAVSIIVGGSHPSAVPEMTSQHPSIDFVIRGEGERPLVEFLKAWIRGDDVDHIPNLAYKKNGAMVLNPLCEPFPPDELPMPDLSDFPLEEYCLEGRPLCFVITSRGCPYRCSFCSAHLTFGTRYRRRSTESIVKEIKCRYEEGYRVFDFEDDNLTVATDEVKSLCRQLIQTFPAGEVRLLAMNGIFYGNLDGELLLLMKQAGFSHLNLSLVSLDPEVNRTMRRPFDYGKYRETVCEAARLGFKIVSYQILGLPGESVTSMVQTLSFSARLPVLLGASPFYLCPRTPAAEFFPPLGERDIFRARLTAMGMDLPECTKEEVYTLFITTRIINFLKGIPFEDTEIPLTTALEIARTRGTRSGTGVEIFERLVAEKQLFAATKQGFKPLPKFKVPLFFDVWSTLDRIGTQTNKTIAIDQSIFR
ncbi:MAG: B12-binding domain-containing radical SAM protein [Deltaproteobacteria bacterium]|nr:B12-binding domain-containing radical SAM protein [Deltaproteobacteria bacterium]